eukprot:Amastigsp_a510833_29.p3 type:complete len:129 gc:universal Amastigsp_a510833_29:1272-886(-)
MGTGSYKAIVSAMVLWLATAQYSLFETSTRSWRLAALEGKPSWCATKAATALMRVDARSVSCVLSMTLSVTALGRRVTKIVSTSSSGTTKSGRGTLSSCTGAAVVAAGSEVSTSRSESWSLCTSSRSE